MKTFLKSCALHQTFVSVCAKAKLCHTAVPGPQMLRQHLKRHLRWETDPICAAGLRAAQLQAALPDPSAPQSRPLCPVSLRFRGALSLQTVSQALLARRRGKVDACGVLRGLYDMQSISEKYFYLVI